MVAQGREFVKSNSRGQKHLLPITARQQIRWLSAYKLAAGPWD
jgi:hypothetical protein